MAAAEGRIEIDGRPFAWTSVGQGPPLLLVNGYAASGADWDPTFLGGLAGAFEVLCPDNRGFGGSELGAAEGLTIEAMAADLEALLDERGLERLPVVGWSMGGFIAQALALRAPGRVSALALLGTDPGGAAAIPPDSAVWSRLTDHSGTPREQASRLIALLFPSELAPRIDREFGELVATARTQISPQALRAQEAAMEAWHAVEQASPQQPPPVLALHGGRDVVIPASNAGALADRWRGEFDLFPGAGHAVMAQEPQRVATLVRAFLA
ncbi:MAG: alpha/beta hydrolase [Solirubrobacterales bacterium]